MNPMHTLLLIVMATMACNSQDKKQLPDSENEPVVQANTKDTTSLTGKRIRGMLEDTKGNFWIATDGAGVGRYKGKSATWYTRKEGLCSDYVRTIQEDKNGHLWFGTSNGVCRYDGKTFTNLMANYALPTYSYSRAFESVTGNLWFGASGGVYGYDGKSFIFCPLSTDSSATTLFRRPLPGDCSKYSVYCVLEDRAGNLWFGTDQKGVCRYDGKSFTWFTKQGLDIGAVRSIYQDKAGNIWIGSNGGGVCYFDGKSLINFSEDKVLSKHLSGSRLEDASQLLNRVWSITEDNTGNIWFGTMDEGAWRYDGKSLVNFTTKDGLASNAVWTIFKDRSERLWFGTDGGGICQYNGSSFTSFTSINF